MASSGEADKTWARRQVEAAALPHLPITHLKIQQYAKYGENARYSVLPNICSYSANIAPRNK
jgi:hypothetical protein